MNLTAFRTTRSDNSSLSGISIWTVFVTITIIIITAIAVLVCFVVVIGGGGGGGGDGDGGGGGGGGVCVCSASSSFGGGRRGIPTHMGLVVGLAKVLMETNVQAYNMSVCACFCLQAVMVSSLV